MSLRNRFAVHPDQSECSAIEAIAAIIGRRQDLPLEDQPLPAGLPDQQLHKSTPVLMNAEAPQEVIDGLKLPSASTMPLSAAWLCVPLSLLPKHLRWLKRKDERRERRDDFANETADDAGD